MIIFFLSLIVGAVLTGLIRRYAVSRSLLDIPNERSSHKQPVPRGGGLAIVLVVLSAVLIAGVMGLLDRSELIAMLGGGGLIAGIGWFDDHRDVSPSFRAIVHFIAASWTVFWLDGLGPVDIGFMSFDLGWIGSLLAVFAIVWSINLYNFMDGTDGIASVQAISAGSFAALVFFSASYIGNNQGYAFITLALVGACVGFLFWNWSPAKIFMGDVASGFLGYFFATIAILGEKSGAVPLLIWSILLAVFFWDATLTLIRRFRNGEKWYAAHRSHAYQRFVQMGHNMHHSHARLAIYVTLINILLLWPLAWLALNYHSVMLIIALASAVIIVSIWFVVQNKYDHKEKHTL